MQWQVDEMDRLQNNKLTKWKADEMAS